ncbi:MAG: 30S ribosomal protein S21 [Planctomycetes bacterium RBG_16_43_13]|nr:MAG: 30S ribosomal protein S21 [Planctomycetes bacterium RBG_16_43_13]
MIRVKAKAGEPLDMLLRRFKKICEKEGLIRDVRKLSYYEKPSETRRRKEIQLARKIEKESQPPSGATPHK